MRKMKGFLAVIVAALLYTVNACKLPVSYAPMPYNGQYMDIYTIGVFNIIGADDPSVKICIEDQDNNGRRLFCIQISNPIFYSYYSNKSKDTMRAYAYGICQKTDLNKVYYYEDVCYRIYASQSDFSDEEKEELEKENDWNLPYNDKKSTSRTIIKGGENKLTATILYRDNKYVLTDDDVMKVYYKALYGRETKEPEDRGYYQSMILDVDNEGNVIGVVRKYDTVDDESLNIEGWFLFLKPNFAINETCIIQKINDMDHYWRELHDFKLRVRTLV